MNQLGIHPTYIRHITCSKLYQIETPVLSHTVLYRKQGHTLINHKPGGIGEF